MPAFERAVRLLSITSVTLKVALCAGLIVAILALLYIFVIIFQKIMGWYEPGWPAIMAAMLLLGGTQLTVLGIMGLYINTIFLESKRRPNYIVKNVLLPDSVQRAGGPQSARSSAAQIGRLPLHAPASDDV